MTSKLLVVGAGGQGKVVIDVLCTIGGETQVVLADEDENKSGRVVAGHLVIAPVYKALKDVQAFHVAVGNNAARERITAYLAKQMRDNPTVMHARATVSQSAQMADGIFLAAYAVVGPDARVSAGCIVNHGAVVDHDCVVNAFCHIAPNATLGGGVTLGRRVLIGAGANVLPGISIGDDCVVGAGAVVLNDLEPRSVHIGVPARKYINK